MQQMKPKLCSSVDFSGIFGLMLLCGLLSLASVSHGQLATPSNAPNPSASKLFASTKDASENSGSVPVAAAAVALVPKALTPAPYLSSLENSNVFDPQRRMWPDRRPPPSPPPPPPVTDKDLQLYGVVIVGQTKRATIKVGSRFAQLDTQGRGFVSVSEGQALGEWTLAEIHPTHLVLGAPGGQQNVMFNKKTDRVATAGLQPTQPTPTGSSSETSANALTAAAVQQPADSNATRPTGATALGGTPVAGAAPVPPTGPDNTIKNAQPGSLAAAISAAQAAAAAAPPSQNAPPPANFNPFLQLFPKQ